MKVAIVHDYIKEYGGAERVLEALHELFPDAPVFTSLYAPSYLGPHKERFADWNIKTSFFQHIPFAENLISPLRIFSSLAFSSFNLGEYDLVIISQTGAYFPNSVKKGNAKLITYTHTPPRYLYGYKTARAWEENALFAFFVHLTNHILRMVDYYASKNVDIFVANSEEVKKRIEKFYRREAIVIYPPAVDTAFSKLASRGQFKGAKLNANQLDANSYYITGGRLARAKGIDIVIEAFNKNKKGLKIFGKDFAHFETKLKKQAQNNIEFVGEVDEARKFELLKNAKAFIFSSFDEDFGITPIEAMSVGTPVIAFRSGGVQETVIDGKTGVFYNENTPESLNKALKRFEQQEFSRKECMKQAQKFSKEEFKKKIVKLIN